MSMLGSLPEQLVFGPEDISEMLSSACRDRDANFH